MRSGPSLRPTPRLGDRQVGRALSYSAERTRPTRTGAGDVLTQPIGSDVRLIHKQPGRGFTKPPGTARPSRADAQKGAPRRASAPRGKVTSPMTKRRDSPSPPQPSTPRRSPTPRATPGRGDEAVKLAARPLAQDAGRRARRRRWRADYLHASSSGRASLAACPPAPRGAPGVSLQGAPRAPRRGGANATGLGARCSVPACAHSWPPWDARPHGHLHLPRFTGGKTERGSGQLAPWAGRRGAGSERR